MLNIISFLARFSTDCRKTKIKAITLANHNRRKQHNEPIVISSKNMQQAPSAGKHVRARHYWFWLFFLMAEKVAFAKFADFSKPYLTISLSKFRFSLNLSFLLFSPYLLLNLFTWQEKVLLPLRFLRGKEMSVALIF